MMKNRASTKEFVKQSIRELKLLIKKDCRLYTTVVKTNARGDCQRVQVLIPRKKEIINISERVADVLGWIYDNDNSAVIVYGLNINAGNFVSMQLSEKMFKDDNPYLFDQVTL